VLYIAFRIKTVGVGQNTVTLTVGSPAPQMWEVYTSFNFNSFRLGVVIEH
jgi:hypothetical protein